MDEPQKKTVVSGLTEWLQNAGFVTLAAAFFIVVFAVIYPLLAYGAYYIEIAFNWYRDLLNLP